MFKIVEASYLSPEVKLFKIDAPAIARKRKAGQFVILRVHKNGERIPLTIADSDTKVGTVTLIVQGVGKSTQLLNLKETGQYIEDIVGPLGKPSEIEKYGTVAVIGGGLGTAIAYPIAKALKDAGNYVVSIIGARTKSLVILEDLMRSISDEPYVTTDDGSYMEKGFVTTKLKSLIDGGRKIDYVLAIGPIPMMRAVSDVTRAYGIKTVVSLNPIMVDGTGMCGGCRVSVNNKTLFACVDGPEFDAHQVDFAVLASRNSMYQDWEKIALDEFRKQQKEHECRLLAQTPEIDAAR